MNLVTFASVLLISSTVVLAFPQEQADDTDSRPGGYTKADINSPEINELAKKLVAKQFAAGSGSGCTQKVNRILSAKTQVVAGQKTILKLEICPENCSNGAVKATECKVCTVEAWERAWEDFLQINKFECPQ